MNTDKQKVLEEYIEYRKLRNHSDTINDIRFHINRFMNYTSKPLKDFDSTLLTSYLGEIRKEYSVGMLNSIKSSFLKNFIKWYYPDWSIKFKNLDLICKQEKTAPSYTPEEMISEEELKTLVKAEPSHFWKAFLLTLFYGGCRPVEVSRLKWKDVEFEKGEGEGAFISIFSDKNKETFIKYVPKDVAFYLKELVPNHKEYVFFMQKEGHIVDVRGVHKHLVRLSMKVLGKKVNPYLLRHSIATIIYNKEGLKDSDVARQMGHKESMKQTYVHNDKKKLKEIAKKIYISPEELPPEKKHELELQNEKLTKDIEQLKKQMSEMNQKIQEGFGLAIEKYARRIKK